MQKITPRKNQKVEKSVATKNKTTEKKNKRSDLGLDEIDFFLQQPLNNFVNTVSKSDSKKTDLLKKRKIKKRQKNDEKVKESKRPKYKRIMRMDSESSVDLANDFKKLKAKRKVSPSKFKNNFSEAR